MFIHIDFLLSLYFDKFIRTQQLSTQSESSENVIN